MDRKLISAILLLVVFEKAQSWGIIMPGTKWCGAGNIAKNDDDLGAYKRTDACCRAHDHCDAMLSRTSKHGLRNNGQITRLHCKCDEAFYNCLHANPDGITYPIGVTYFNLINQQCYDFRHPATCIKYEDEWKKSRCLKYSYNRSLPKKWQWFDEKPFPRAIK